MEEFKQRMTAVQDADRGIPESRISDIEAAQKEVDHKLLERYDEFMWLKEESSETYQRSNGEVEESGLQALSNRPLLGEMAQISELSRNFETASHHQRASLRAFQIPFRYGLSYGNFDTESPVRKVRQGIVGWGSHSTPPPILTNAGRRKGQHINGNLFLGWHTNVPHDGIFQMHPNQYRSRFPVFGRHKVRGRGWAFSGNDARVEVHVWVIAYLDSKWLYARHRAVSSDATKSENRTKSFGKWISLPGKIRFRAKAGQRLGMYIYLSCKTWANDDGLAKLNINLFGVPSNWLRDMHINVYD